MRAVQLTAFGNPVDGLEYVDIPEPDAPGPNQVLIGVEFSRRVPSPEHRNVPENGTASARGRWATQSRGRPLPPPCNPARRAIAWSLVPVVCSYKINERQWESDHAENSPPHLPKSA